MDWGGVFRDAINRMVEDLFSTHLTLMVPCPNALAAVDADKDKCVAAPSLGSCVLLACVKVAVCVCVVSVCACVRAGV